MEKRVTKSAEETRMLGKNLASTLRGGEVIALFGDLGSGKTTFVQGLAEGLGIKQRIISPTFLILKTYKLSEKESNLEMLQHIDLYRIAGNSDIEELGLFELFEEKENIVVIEWPEKLSDRLPKSARKIHFSYISDIQREITYEN